MDDEIAALLDVVSRLDQANVPYMLTGSMALNLYAMPRMTRDIDLVAAVAMDDAKRIMAIFPEEFYYVAEEAAREAVIHEGSFNVIHLATMTKVDLMIRKSHPYRLEEFNRKRLLTIRDQEVWVVSKEDLILSKLEWARDSFSERQLDDVRNLLATGCDLDYLRSWAERLQLNAMLTRVSE